MTINEESRIINFINFFNNNQINGADYKGFSKYKFKVDGKYVLKLLAAQLGLNKEQYDLRFNAGGPAVSGEVTLHTDNIYIQISDSCMGKRNAIMFRTCKGRKDYTGGQNNFTDVSAFLGDRLFNSVKRLLDGYP